MNYKIASTHFLANFLKFLKQYPLILAFVISIAVANVWKLVQGANKIDNPATTPTVTTTLPQETDDAISLATSAITTEPIPVFQTVDASYFDDALFIGDSRTEGLALYGDLSNADYFTSVGMSIFKVTEKSAGNPNLGESCTLSQKLAQKQYGKVYIMLGLNELGTGTTESWSQTYADVIAQVRQAQPNAIIYLQSILVVSASQNDPSSAINNTAVNTRNAALEALANPQNNIYYLNVNEAVMDANGCLDASLTSDGIHLLGNSLSLWEDYLKQHAINSNGTAGMSTVPTSPTTYTTAVPTAPLSE
ncbi:GDSL-type esterase/lipase family protein [Ruminococcus sp.]|uniref:GDSL-type esterase/lipase family protein n=1 Tax=Ruminococcus sp. TaxID=41978 RepID=UPI0025DD1573|nr:GDSL-type esterase/lipase family protein [Ruminococcus sp.]